MLWVKAFHIVFVASWFAGLFYLPRIFVNLAIENDPAARRRLLLMARKLYRFMTLLAAPALGFGIWLWVGYGIGRGPGNGWLSAKLALVLMLIGYNYVCWYFLRKFEMGTNRHSDLFYRWFNEIPVLILVAVAILVVVKPF